MDYSKSSVCDDGLLNHRTKLLPPTNWNVILIPSTGKVAGACAEASSAKERVNLGRLMKMSNETNKNDNNMRWTWNTCREHEMFNIMTANIWHASIKQK